MATSKKKQIPVEHVDVIVIGSGFGGLGAALTLAEGGAKVAVLETVGYPGGCASTYERGGKRYESGATLFSGFAEGQLFERWIRRHGMAVEVSTPDPVVELRAPGLELPLAPRRGEMVETFCSLPGAPRKELKAFFDFQRRVADALWDLFDDPRLLPPLGLDELMLHARRLPSYLPLVRLIGRSAATVARRFGVWDFEPLRIYLDAVSQITVQASASEAEAPFALGAMDYYFRGTGHVHGGIGALAQGMVGAIENLGGEVHYFRRATGISAAHGSRWRVETRRGALEAPALVANLLPQAIDGLLEGELPRPERLNRLARQVEGGWGAAMLYLTLAPNALERTEAHHLELVQDPSKPFTEGNHLFCSISDAAETERAPGGRRTVTVSTHVDAARIAAMSQEEQASYIGSVQERMDQGLRALAPELAAGIEDSMPGSPRTFRRFTGRPEGFVGGIPRRVGLQHYDPRELGPQPLVIAGRPLYLVGDTVFPGQSTLATALGGRLAAERILSEQSFEGPTIEPDPRGGRGDELSRSRERGPGFGMPAAARSAFSES
ncbi:MAG: NAD(P)/FAD-dependent oxidoreductase [Acidobacteriota bacterium]